MSITCPKCGNAFEKTLFPLGPRVGCPRCGTHFDLAVGSTMLPGGAPGGAPDDKAIAAAETKPALSPAEGPTPVQGPPREEVVVESESLAAPSDADAVALAPGAVLGSCVLEREIGRGGMGTVWLATQRSLNRRVAVKVLAPRLSRDPHFIARFEREARSLAALSHPNIVAILDRGQSQGHYFFVMEWVDGESLRALMLAKTMSPEAALRLVPQICAALEYAHSRGVIHRDIKPENILLARDGAIKIADFGLSRLMGQELPDGAITATNMVMGTMDYMAPEQRERAKAVDHRADIYSLGVVFYEMLTGELPIGRFEPPSRRNVQVDVSLDRVVLKVLEKDPEMRYQRASHVATDLEAVQGSARVGAGAAAAGAAFADRAAAAMQGAATRGRAHYEQAQPWLAENWNGPVLAAVMVLFFFSLCGGVTMWVGITALVVWGIMGSHVRKQALRRVGYAVTENQDTDVLWDHYHARQAAERGDAAAADRVARLEIKIGRRHEKAAEKAARRGDVEPPAPVLGGVALTANAPAAPAGPPRPRFSILALLAFVFVGVVALPVPLLYAFAPELESFWAGFGSEARALTLTLALPVVGVPLLVLFALAMGARARFRGRPELRGLGLARLAVLLSLGALIGTGYAWSHALTRHREWKSVEVRARLESPDDAATLAEWLDSTRGDEPGRALAARVVERIEGPGARGVVEGLLGIEDGLARADAAHPDPALRAAAVRWLVAHPDADADAEGATAVLARAAADPDPRVRAAAFAGLGRAGDDGVTLLLALPDSTIAGCEADYLAALGATRHPEAVRRITAYLADPRGGRLIDAAQALAVCGPAGWAELCDRLDAWSGPGDAERRRAVLRALADARLAEQAPALLPRLARRLGDDARAVREEAVRLLANAGRAAADTVAAQLAATDRRTRWNAAVVLEDIGSERHVAALEAARDADDQDDDAYRDAIRAIQSRARRRR